MDSTYQTLLLILCPFMINLFNALGEDSVLPRDTLRAHISVIPKEGKDPTSCCSYRPISLLNIDLKLFTKILVTHLANHLQDLAHLDHVGFVPTNEVRDNTIKVLNQMWLHIATTNHSPFVFLSTNVEKALDCVNCQHMFSVLLHLGLGDTIIKWIS